VLAQADAAEPVVRQSYLAWTFRALGPFYGLMLPLLGFAIFVGACVVVALNRRPAVIASYLVFVPVPLLIGIFGSVRGSISALSVVAMSTSDQDVARWMAEGGATALFTTLVGFLVSAPSYAVVALGLFARTLAAKPAGIVEAELK
jgi:hypothetical protein